MTRILDEIDEKTRGHSPAGRLYGRFDIQFFAQERTEPATPKKRQKVRSEGKVCTSRDLTAAT